MPKKLQSFVVLKLQSRRLKEHNYKLNISLLDARKNGELVRLGDSELLRKIREIRGQEFFPESLELLIKKKDALNRRTNSIENRKEILEVTSAIDNILFVSDIIVLGIDDIRHYKKIIENGLIINDKKYSRLLCSAGHARRSTVIFANNEIIEQLFSFLDCGRNLTKKINPNKFTSYHALASSATLQVSRPNFVVIPDYEINKMTRVDWFIPQDEGTDPIFEERVLEQKTSIFDGQGLISPTQARIWAEDVEIDWLPAAFIFRVAFSKGLLVTFDFHKYAQEMGVRKITDIYGVEHWIDDIEVILSLSQFKMADSYTNLNEYSDACKANNFGWGITRFTPKKDKDSVTTTYQYLQAIDISKEKIPQICSSTVGWLQNISGLDWRDALIFLLGEIETFDDSAFKSCDVLAKTILLEPECLKDNHIRKKLLRLINKKIREAYVGILKTDGNYQFLVADPCAQCQHALGLSVTGLINRRTAYSAYWQNKKVNKISCFRSPMTWRSEHLVIDLDEYPDKWYEYQYSNIIFNIYDDWMMRLSGADVDGDIVMTTPSFTDCHYDNLNIPTYDRKTAEKEIINKTSLWKSDTLSFGSKIGLITNLGTTFFSMMPLFDGKKEEAILVNRLKSCNVFQNMQIDKTKGITIYSLPDWWDKWNKDNENSEIYNKLLAKQRPYFMRYIYSAWNKRYKHHFNSYDNICIVRFGFSLTDLLKTSLANMSEEQLKIYNEFYERSPLIDSPSIMNNVCHYTEQQVQEIRLSAKSSDFDYHIYTNPEIALDVNKLQKIELLWEKWKAFQRNSHDRTEEADSEEVVSTKDEYIKILEREAYSISNNLSELTNLLVEVCYGRHGENSKEFCWKMFDGAGIVKNLVERCRGFIQIPLLDESGLHEYLGRKYLIKNVILGEE